MIQYQQNNILFRTVSAAAISKFKAVQAHSLGQLSRKELEFDSSAKEVVLLSFDRFSQWVYRVERICLASVSTDQENTVLLSTLSASFADEQMLTQMVIESHSEIFSQKIAKYVLNIHANSALVIDQYFRTLTQKKIDVIYADIVDIVISYLQHILIAMHEYNNNIVTRKEKPFISMADFRVNNDTDSLRLQQCLQRLKFFQEEFKTDEYVFKYYGTNIDEALSAFGELKDAAGEIGIALTREQVLYKEE